MENKKLEEALKNFYNSLTDEQKEKVKACKSSEDFLKLTEEGLELPDEIMDNVAGGDFFDAFKAVITVVQYTFKDISK